jgi:hypothetical protein
MAMKLTPLLSKADWCRSCIHLRNINHHFKVVEGMEINIIALKSPSMIWCWCSGVGGTESSSILVKESGLFCSIAKSKWLSS